jgi:membrane-associated progesterone receptor component
MAYSFDLSTPLNTALLLYILYSVHRVVLPSASAPSSSTPPPHEFRHAYSWMPAAHPPTVLFRLYTPTTLARFDGRDGGRILLAISGIVFDVTAGRSFYGPGMLFVFGSLGL